MHRRTSVAGAHDLDSAAIAEMWDQDLIRGLVNLGYELGRGPTQWRPPHPQRRVKSKE
jgi:hypothetical protein